MAREPSSCTFTYTKDKDTDKVINESALAQGTEYIRSGRHSPIAEGEQSSNFKHCCADMRGGEDGDLIFILVRLPRPPLASCVEFSVPILPVARSIRLRQSGVRSTWSTAT